LRSRIGEKRDRLDDALVYIQKAVRLEPRNVSLKINYAKLLGQNNKLNEAWSICEPLLADEAALADPEIKSRLGIVLTEIHKNEPAFRLLSEAVNSTGDKEKIGAETWNYLGILYFRKKDYNQALEAYRQSIRKDPGIARTYNNLGTLYLTQFVQTRDSRHRDHAVEAFNKALEIDPRLVSALNGRGSAYKFSNRIQESLKDWQTAISIKPDFIDAYFNIGITYLQLKEKKRALDYFNRCKEKFYQKLPPRDRRRLERLIREAGG
jgi:tetratricopeptide (TPR) repeat protein